MAYSHTAGYLRMIRARIVRDAARGYSNARIAVRQQVTVDTVRHWRGRYAEEAPPGLRDRPRPGRPPRFTPVQVAEIKARNWLGNKLDASKCSQILFMDRTDILNLFVVTNLPLPSDAWPAPAPTFDDQPF